MLPPSRLLQFPPSYNIPNLCFVRGASYGRFRGCGGIDPARLPDSLHLVWSSLGLHRAELLGRTKTSESVVASGKAAESRGVCLFLVQSSSASGKPLDLPTVQDDV